MSSRAPQAFPKRIPDDLEFVVNPDPTRALGVGAMMGVAFATIMGAVYLLPMAFTTADDPWTLPVMVGLYLFMIIGFGGLMAVAGMTGGPLLACDHDGLWIRSRKTPRRALYLPWEAIDEIYIRRWGFERVVSVRPHDPRTGTLQGVLADLEQAQAKLITGSKLFASILFGDTREPAVMAALAHYADGRCRVTPRP